MMMLEGIRAQRGISGVGALFICLFCLRSAGSATEGQNYLVSGRLKVRSLVSLIDVCLRALLFPLLGSDLKPERQTWSSTYSRAHLPS